MPTDLLACGDWAVKEFSKVELGDARLDRRAVAAVALEGEAVAMRPGKSLPETLGGGPSSRFGRRGWRSGRRGTGQAAASAEPATVVEAREVGAPEGVEPVEWVLLASWQVESFEDAVRVIKTYARRRLIEEYHKAL